MLKMPCKKRVVFASVLLVFVGSISFPASAALRGERVFDDSQLVSFEADANNVYEVVSHDKLFTDFQMGQGEQIQEAYLSDKRPLYWRTIVSANRQHFLVKPMKAGVINTATIITNKNTYQIRFLPSVAKGRWNQRVTWNYGDEAVFRAANAAATLNAAKAFPDAPDHAIKLANINADYAITGSSSIRPIAVIDDGRRTKITFAASLQEMPVLFVKASDGKLTLAGWSATQEPNGTRSITVSQLFTGAVLKLGDAKVEIINNRFPAQ